MPSRGLITVPKKVFNGLSPIILETIMNFLSIKLMVFSISINEIGSV